MTLKNHPYLYLGSVSEARRNDELEMWRDSHKQNILCKQAIEETIRKGFDGMPLDQDCAKSVIEEYGFKRVGWVLASTLQQKKDDGRFSPRNKEWAGSTFIPPSDRNHDFTVQSHPAVLDGQQLGCHPEGSRRRFVRAYLSGQRHRPLLQRGGQT